MRNALLIAFHFPPFHGSSGLQRTLSYCRGLPVRGWRPLVLTVNTRAYDRTDAGQLADIPPDATVERAFALDSKRHLAVRGRYLHFTALPDQWISWLPAGVIQGLRLVRRFRPAVLWSTYPIATAHVIGWALHRISGLPWVADFRDPMVETIPRTGEQFPRDPTLRRARLRVEALVARRAAAAVFCTDSAAGIFAQRYAGFARDRLHVIANGYDEGIFAEVERARAPVPRTADRPLVLLHSGVLYQSTDRSPEGLFDALRLLLADGRIGRDDLRIVLRATGYDHAYRPMISERGLESIVRLEPPTGYREALAEMLDADGLLLVQGYTSNPAIPAKAYEYLRARRPVFALVDDEGETARLLARARVARLAPLDDPVRIAQQLLAFIADVRAGAIEPLSGPALYRYSREARTSDLAGLFDRLAAGPSAADLSRPTSR
jgi:glycosyltransferase involved in cell wall biosynthesis